MPILKLSSITCMVPDESDKDELYLKLNGRKIWPKKSKYHRIDTDETVKINMRFRVTEGRIALEVWDYDLASKDDHLGTFFFAVKNKSGRYSELMTNNMEVSEHASYLLNWEIEAEEVVGK